MALSDGAIQIKLRELGENFEEVTRKFEAIQNDLKTIKANSKCVEDTTKKQIDDFRTTVSNFNEESFKETIKELSLKTIQSNSDRLLKSIESKTEERVNEIKSMVGDKIKTLKEEFASEINEENIRNLKELYRPMFQLFKDNVLALMDETPDPQIFALSLKKMGVEESAVLIFDFSENDCAIETGRSADKFLRKLNIKLDDTDDPTRRKGGMFHASASKK